MILEEAASTKDNARDRNFLMLGTKKKNWLRMLAEKIWFCDGRMDNAGKK